MSTPWVRVGGITLFDEAVLLEMKIGEGRDLLEAIAFRKVAAARAREAGITLSGEEMEDALTGFYTERDLFEPEQMVAWRRSVGVEEEDIRRHLWEHRLVEAYRRHVGSPEAVEKRFRANQPDYSRAEVEVFTFANEGASREFVLAVREGEIMDARGETRQVSRRDAPEEIAAALFSSRAGELLGPVETGEEETRYEVFRLVHRTHPQLDEALQEAIRDELFREAVGAVLSRDPISFVMTSPGGVAPTRIRPVTDEDGTRVVGDL
ncbi:MAG: hypothetical protein HYY93_08910 [Planctomycetes bacterium]|nr:hypothetical protein [Planctomycetota bacterium]